MSIARYVNLSFVVIGLVAYLVLGEFLTGGLELFGSATNFPILGVNFRLAQLLAMVAAVGFAIWLRRNQKVYDYAMEVGSELSKVTWPTWKETKLATIVVIVTTLIISVILGVMDLIWGALQRLLYS
ncbi:MAG: preprotein translocase subunit SecE [Myxococcota bacterium]